MSGSLDSAAANEWRRAQQAAQAEKRLGLGKAHTKPSGLGTQIDAMIQRLIEDGHSRVNIARVMRLRAEKMEAGE
jgi:hypothetical protein